jgi:hypothetical protein
VEGDGPKKPGNQSAQGSVESRCQLRQRRFAKA